MTRDATVARVEELTVRFLDGEAAPAERDELAALVEADAEARRVHLGLVEIEVALRGGRPAEVAPAVMEQIARERADRAVRGVMSALSSVPPPARGPRGTSLRRWAAALALAVAGLAALWWSRSPAPPAASAPPRPRVMGRAETPARSSVRTEPAGIITVLALDFEDDELPGALIDGERSEGPCAPGSQRCLAGTESQYARDHDAITLERHRPPLFSYAPGQVLSFDYSVGAAARSVRLQVWSGDRHANFTVELEDVIREHWAHAEIRLLDLRGYGGRGPLESGDAVNNLMFLAGRRDGAPFALDNLKVAEYPQGASLPATSAALPLPP